MSVFDVAAWVARNKETKASYRGIASRLARKVKQMQDGEGAEFNIKVVEAGEIGSVALRNSRGVTIAEKKKGAGLVANIELKGESLGKENGMKVEVILHEIIHAVTSMTIREGSYVKNDGPEHKATKDLIRLSNTVIEHFNKRSLTPGVELTAFEQANFVRNNNALSGPDEVLAWGLTNAGMQEYMETIPYGKENAWGAFVTAIRGMLGLPKSAETTLSELLRIADVMLDIDAKAKKVSTTEDKADRTGASDVSGTTKDSVEGTKPESVSKGGSKSTPSDTAKRSERSDSLGDSDSGTAKGKDAEQRQSAKEDTGSKPSQEAGGRDSDSKRSGDTEQLVGRNYQITPDDNLGAGGSKTKARQNIDAIRIVKQLEAEKRPATPEEQAKLVKYTGWGASELANRMFPRGKPVAAWRQLADDLKSLLTDAEYKAARRTTQYAHYTSESVINSIYKGLERVGFNGGLIFEPGSGAGHFAGLMPQQMSGRSHYTGIEYDPMTAAIAKHLYPESSIREADLTRTDVPENHYDLVIGNPPFASTIIRSDKKYNKHKFALHEYFFAKSIDSVRPGGVLVFVTSRYLMDKGNAKARAYLEERADLLGAMRLPQTAFKKNAGTEVVTDVLFFRKREEGAEPAGEAWNTLKEIQTPEGPATINEYFADNPDQVLGTNSLQGSMYSANEYTVLAPEGAIEDVFEESLQALPEDAYQAGQDMEERIDAQKAVEFASSTLKRNSFFLKDGVLMQNQAGKGVKAKVKQKGRGEGLYKGAAEKITQLVPIKEKAMQLLDAQLNGRDYDRIQDELNKAYDQFVKKHGAINHVDVRTRKARDGSTTEYDVEPNFPKPFWTDPDAAILSTLDSYDPVTKKTTKGKILTGRVMAPPKPPEVNTPSDALATSLNKFGRIDIESMADMLGMSEADVVDSLGDMVYRDPIKDSYQTQDEYLSGEVRKKLAEAKVAAEDDHAYNRNVRALEDVQPTDIPPSAITARIGAVWIPPADIEAFMAEKLGSKGKITYIRAINTWMSSGLKVVDQSVASNFSTVRMSFKDILDAALNHKSVTVYDNVYSDGKNTRVLNAEQTELAREQLGKLKAEFGKWVWDDGDRAERLASTYNLQYNDIVPRKFNGDHLTMPGITSSIKLRPHQARVVWRILQTGSTYMAHTVGAGKTMAAVAAGMEQKRLGLVKKPMYAVPNHMLKQFSKEFLELYPTAKILVADEENFHTKTRKEFVARSATEDWDAVIITHSAFKLIKAPAEQETALLEKQLSDFKAALEAMPEEEQTTRKRMEKMIENAEQGMSAIQNRDSDDGISFEQLGIDQLFVDEAHGFRKLSYATSQGNIKGIDPNGSQASWDMFVKSRYLDSINPGRGLVLMSGTPVTNTMGEMYTLQRFMQPKELERKGLESFDAWAAQYTETREITEQTPSGGYKVVTRLAKFVNLPELLRSFRDVADVVRGADLDGYVTRPAIKGGGLQLVTAESSTSMKSYQKHLAKRMDAIEKRKGPPKKGDDILLTVITDGRHAAIDDRYIHPDLASNPGTKLNLMLASAYETWRDTKDLEFIDAKTGEVEPAKGATQMIFADLGVTERSGFAAYNEIKQQLIAKGIPEKEIAFMRDYKKGAAKLKLFSDMNAGRVRILVGSSKNMGTGVNAQQRLVHLHHLDAPWFPADMEQRNGRIERQGNKNKVVGITGYATKGTYDSTMFTMLETKQRFIDQMWTDDFVTREMDDLDGDADQYAQAKALSSGDERLIQKIGLEQDVQRLTRLKNAHYDEQLAAKRRKSEAINSIKWQKGKIEQLKEDLTQRIDTSGDKFTMKIGRSAFTERKKAGARILKEVDKAHNSAEATRHELILADLAGFKVQAYIADRKRTSQGPGERKWSPELSLSTAAGGSFTLPSDITPLGLITKLENQAKRIDADILDAERQIETSKAAIEKSDAIVGNEFDRLDELTTKADELHALEEDILNTPDDMGAETEAARTPVDTGRMAPLPSDVMFRRSKSASKSVGITSVKLDAIFKGISSKWKRSPDLRSVARSVDLPDAIKAEAKRQNAPLDTIDGVFHKGAVYLVRDKIQSQRHAEEVIFHEVYGHFGMRRLFNGKPMRAMYELYHEIGGAAGVDRLSKKYGVKLGHYKKGVRDLPQHQQEAIIMDELLAHIAQQETGTLREKARSLIQAIKFWLRENGFKWLAGDHKDSADAVITDVLRRARKSVFTGKSDIKEGTAFHRAWHGTPHDVDQFSMEDSLIGDTVLVNGVEYKNVNSEAEQIARTEDGVINFWEWFGEGDALDSDGSTRFSRREVEGDFSDAQQAEEILNTKIDEGSRWEDNKAGMAKRIGMLSKGARRNALALLSRRQLVEVSEKLLPRVRAFLRHNEQMDADRIEWQSKAADVTETWGKLSSMHRKGLAKVMHAATVAGVDPSVPFKVGLTEDQYKEQLEQLESRALIKGHMASGSTDIIMQILQLKERYAKEQGRKAAYPSMVKAWKILSKDQQAVYKEARDYHEDMSDEMLEALLERLEESGSSIELRNDVSAQLRLQFETAKGHAPYFPLSRFGEYVVSVGEGKTKTVDFFETEKEAVAFYKEMKAEGNEVTYTKKFDDLSDMGMIPLQFVNDVNELIKGADKYNEEQQKLLKDGVYQLYLQSLPEMSSRKHSIHRAKVRGFSDDALRSFAHVAFHGSSNLAKVKHAHKIQGELDALKKDVSEANSPEITQTKISNLRLFMDHYLGDSERDLRRQATQTEDKELNEELHEMSRLAGVYRNEMDIEAEIDRLNIRLDTAANINKDTANVATASDYVSELSKSHDDAMSSSISPVATWANQLGFTFYLGLTPAAAIVNTFQVPMVTIPLLGGTYGNKKATAAVGKAYAEYFSNREKKHMPTIETSLKGDDLAAYKELVRRGVIDKTQAHDLAGMAEEGARYSAKMHKVMGVLSFGFHHAEKLNREVTAMASYRLAREAGDNMTLAIEKASELTFKSQFDYGSTNRARFFRGNTARVLTQFKQYSQGITYLYGRALHQAFKNESPEARTEAKKQLIGMLAAQFAVTGLLGMPAVRAIGMIAEVLVNAGDDDDDEFDYEAWIRQTFADAGGNTVGTALSKGIVDAITPVSLHGRLSVSELWYREPLKELEGRASYFHLMEQILGPVVGGMTKGIFTGASNIADGRIYRGAEQMLPKVLRDGMKAVRYGTEGVTTYDGNTILETRAVDSFIQAAGFSPSNVSNRYDENSAKKGLEVAIAGSRKKLIAKVVNAQLSGETKQLQELFIKVREFNQRNPYYPIGNTNIKRSMAAKVRARNDMENGQRINKRLRGVAGEYNFGG